MSRRLLLAALCIAATSGYLRLAASVDRNPPPERLASLPAHLSVWAGADEPRLDRETEATLNADAYLLRSYARGPIPVSLFVAFYGSQRSGRTIHSPLNCLPGTGWIWASRGRESVRTDNGVEVELNRNTARRDGRELLVYYWYQSRGRAVASDYTNKLLLVRDALTEHRSDGAIVRVTVDATRNGAAAAREATAFIQALYPALTAHLPE